MSYIKATVHDLIFLINKELVDQFRLGHNSAEIRQSRYLLSSKGVRKFSSVGVQCMHLIKPAGCRVRVSCDRVMVGCLSRSD